MKIVVTGGLGFIGSRFVKLCMEEGHEVKIIDKMTYAADLGRLPDNTGYWRKDICDVTKNDIDGYDYIVNFAAETHVDNSIMDGRPFIRSNVEGVFNLLEVSRQVGIKKFIQISTDEVYGDKIQGESLETDRIIGSSYYSASKASADLLVLSACSTYSLPFIITRSCNNYGPKQHSEKFLPKVLKCIKEGKEVPVYGDGENVREWIHVDDNVQQIYNLMISPAKNQIFNIGTKERYSNIKLMEKIADELGTSVQYKFVEDRLGHDGRYALCSNKINECHKMTYKKLTDFLKEEVIKLK